MPYIWYGKYMCTLNIRVGIVVSTFSKKKERFNSHLGQKMHIPPNPWKKKSYFFTTLIVAGILKMIIGVLILLISFLFFLLWKTCQFIALFEV